MYTVNDLMTVNPRTIRPETTLRRILELMKREGCRQIPVVDGNKLLGMVTERDVRLVMNSPLILQNRSQDEVFMDNIIAEGFMTRDLLTVSPDTPVHIATEMLSIYKFGALPVIEDRMLVGIITVTDFLDHATEQYREQHLIENEITS